MHLAEGLGGSVGCERHCLLLDAGESSTISAISLLPLLPIKLWQRECTGVAGGLQAWLLRLSNHARRKVSAAPNRPEGSRTNKLFMTTFTSSLMLVYHEPSKLGWHFRFLLIIEARSEPENGILSFSM
jgi:hypothetical protein